MAAASSALYFLAGAGAGSFGVGEAGVFFWVLAAGVARADFFLAVMVELHGRQLGSSGGTPIAPLHPGRRSTSTAPSPPGNSPGNPQVFHRPNSMRPSWRCRLLLLAGAPDAAPAPPLLVPIQRRRHVQDVA